MQASAPHKLFRESHLYTASKRNGDRDFTLERRFSRFESIADSIIQKIVESARKGVRPGLTSQEKATWDQFVYLQWKRVPDTIKEYTSLDEVGRLVTEGLVEYERIHGVLSEKKRTEILSPEGIRKIRQNALVQAIADPGADVLEVLSKRGLCFAVIHDKRRSFIIGGNPIVKLTLPGKAHLGDPSVEVWFPIASDVAVSPGFARSEEHIVKITNHAHVRKLNEHIADQSTVFAGRSKQLIQSLARRR